MGDDFNHDGERSGTDQSPRWRRQTIPLDTVFQLLSNQRRRYALYCLNRFPGSAIEIDTLVQHISGMETDSQPELTELGADTDDAEPYRDTYHHKLAVDLLHKHLPKLETAGVIDYDTRSGMIRYWVHPSLQEWLEHAEYKECEQRLGS